MATRPLMMFEVKLTATEEATYGVELVGQYSGKFLRVNPPAGQESGDGLITPAMLPTFGGRGTSPVATNNVRATASGGESIYHNVKDQQQTPVMPPYAAIWVYRVI